MMYALIQSISLCGYVLVRLTNINTLKNYGKHNRKYRYAGYFLYY